MPKKELLATVDSTTNEFEENVESRCPICDYKEPRNLEGISCPNCDSGKMVVSVSVEKDKEER